MWTLEFLVAASLVGVVIVLIVFGLLLMHGRDAWPGDLTPFRVGLSVLLVLIVAGAAFGFYPYKAEYHKWQVKDGTITEISKRLVGDGDGMQEKFVVVFAGSGQQYGCLDTRCALLGPGDYLKLACKKVWDYGSTDGWDCKFREAREV